MKLCSIRHGRLADFAGGPGAAMLAAGLLLGAAAHAQPAGNPQGTATPSTRGEAQERPATRAPDTGRDTGTQGTRTNPGAPMARSGQLRQPGSGTTGGLSGHHPKSDAAGTGTTETNQAPPAKK